MSYREISFLYCGNYLTVFNNAGEVAIDKNLVNILRLQTVVKHLKKNRIKRNSILEMLVSKSGSG